MRYIHTIILLLALALTLGGAGAPESQAAAPGDTSERHALLLSAGTVDTRQRAGERLRAVSAERMEGAGPQLWLVQFAGPIQRAWYAALERTGVRVVTAIPVNAYLVSGDAPQLRALAELTKTQPAIQWDGPYHAAYRIAPGMRDDQQQRVDVQILGQHAENQATLDLLGKLSATPLQIQPVLHYLNARASLPPGALAQLARRPDVVAIQPATTPARLDESQSQIVAGNISGNGPAAGDYLAWLAAQGFTQAQFHSSGFIVDIADAGVDNGTLQPNHFALREGGLDSGASRVAYSRFLGTTGQGATLAGIDGHGTLNAHIIGGYVPGGAPYNAFPHADASGLRYGMGVAPFVRIGASVLFDNRTTGNDYTSPDFGDMVSRAYADGARISNNSWGSRFPSGGRAGTGEAFYSFEAQRYDALVRDAQPADSASPAPGNQEIVMVFAAGNSGPSATTISSPGLSKNVITVGASEGVRSFGGGQDNAGVGESGADNLNDVIGFSSRGPTVDGRSKPDLVAPGTHIVGGVVQAASPAATGTADPAFTGFGISGGPTSSADYPFFPAQQEWYSASSGTSHAAPAVAGGAALLRQWFINAGLAPPSPAMTKAMLVSSARYLTGAGAGDTLPSPTQGMGLIDLGRAFSSTPRLLRDQRADDLFSESGQQRTFVGVVADPSQPLRITLAWTDAPGPTMSVPYLNNLDLRVQVAGITYLGNVFTGATSSTGGVSDQRNNLESVFLPPGTPAGAMVVITVTATNIMADGVPGNASALDQDFALVGSNVSSPAPFLGHLPLVARP